MGQSARARTPMLRAAAVICSCSGLSEALRNVREKVCSLANLPRKCSENRSGMLIPTKAHGLERAFCSICSKEENCAGTTSPDKFLRAYRSRFADAVCSVKCFWGCFDVSSRNQHAGRRSCRLSCSLVGDGASGGGRLIAASAGSGLCCSVGQACARRSCFSLCASLWVDQSIGGLLFPVDLHPFSWTRASSASGANAARGEIGTPLPAEEARLFYTPQLPATLRIHRVYASGGNVIVSVSMEPGFWQVVHAGPAR